MNFFCLNKNLNKFNSGRILRFLVVMVLLKSSEFSPFHLSAKSPLTESISSIQAKALNGDAHYQGILALFHKFGERSLAVDIQEAKRWAKLAAEKDGAIGLCALAAISLESGKTNQGRFLYDEAYLHSNLLALAKDEDPFALYCLGMIEIDNPPRNLSKAIRHLEASAEMGFASAQATLGMINFTGIGVKKNSKQAIKWCSRAAKVKLPLGMFYLGMAYSVGDGVEKNDDFSIRWIRTAADRNLVMAQLTLGMKYATGDGVKKSLETAVNWLHRASVGGSQEAKLQLRKYENHLERLNSPPAVYIPDSQIKSISTLAETDLSIAEKNKISNSPAIPKTSDKDTNNYDDEFDAVNSAMSVLTVEKNRDKAKSLLELPAKNGNFLASKHLGLIYYKENNYETAFDWFNVAAKGEDSESFRYIGIMYFLGQGVKQDYEQAKHWFTKAIETGDFEAARYIRILNSF